MSIKNQLKEYQCEIDNFLRKKFGIYSISCKLIIQFDKKGGNDFNFYNENGEILKDLTTTTIYFRNKQSSTNLVEKFNNSVILFVSLESSLNSITVIYNDSGDYVDLEDVSSVQNWDSNGIYFLFV